MRLELQFSVGVFHNFLSQELKFHKMFKDMPVVPQADNVVPTDQQLCLWLEKYANNHVDKSDFREALIATATIVGSTWKMHHSQPIMSSTCPLLLGPTSISTKRRSWLPKTRGCQTRVCKRLQSKSWCISEKKESCRCQGIP